MYLNIKDERISKGWTQQFVADNIGISKQSVYDIETGRRNPSYDILVKLENLFQLSHRDLFGAVPVTEKPDSAKTASSHGNNTIHKKYCTGD